MKLSSAGLLLLLAAAAMTLFSDAESGTSSSANAQVIHHGFTD
ncbi:hypothetical protein [Roseibium sp. MMSF_3544]|nr:hypothetical protein [Roseibium sp. MMSF_3544]